MTLYEGRFFTVAPSLFLFRCNFPFIIQNGLDYKKKKITVQNEDLRMCPQSKHNEEKDQRP